MLKSTAFALLLVLPPVPALAQEGTWRGDIKPLLEAHCLPCHGERAPEYNEWQLLDDQRKTVGPRMDTYPHFMSYVVWPATGAMMRRLDDGKATEKPGNMYEYLGSDGPERARNLQIIKDWLGEGAWNLNRWQTRGDVPGVSKEQLETIRARY